MRKASRKAAAGTPSVGEGAIARAGDAVGLRSICAASAGVVLDDVAEIAIIGTGRSVRLPKHRVPAAAELEVFTRVAALVPMGGSFATTLTDDELVAAIDELRPPWSEKPKHVVEVTVMPMAAPAAGATMPVDTSVLAAFLNDVGERGVAADVEDLQVLLGKAVGGARRDVKRVQGLIADLDYKVPDPAKEHLLRGALPPNVVFATENGGARLLYVFESPFAPTAKHPMDARESLFHVLNVAFPRLDAASREIQQRQYLPSIIRTTKGPRRVVSRTAIPIAVRPLRLDDFTPSLPKVALDALGLGSGELGDAERDEILAYLEAIGIALPPFGRTAVSRCPIKQHSSRKVFIGRNSRGAIHCRCLSQHGGAGQKSWNEHDLLRLARGGLP